MSENAENGSIPSGYKLIDSSELASRWKVPESWIRNHTRQRTSKAERIPCIRLGRYAALNGVRRGWKSGLQGTDSRMRNLLDARCLPNDEVLRFVNAGLHPSTSDVVQVFKQYQRDSGLAVAGRG